MEYEFRPVMSEYPFVSERDCQYHYSNLAHMTPEEREFQEFKARNAKRDIHEPAFKAWAEANGYRQTTNRQAVTFGHSSSDVWWNNCQWYPTQPVTVPNQQASSYSIKPKVRKSLMTRKLASSSSKRAKWVYKPYKPEPEPEPEVQHQHKPTPTQGPPPRRTLSDAEAQAICHAEITAQAKKKRSWVYRASRAFHRR